MEIRDNILLAGILGAIVLVTGVFTYCLLYTSQCFYVFFLLSEMRPSLSAGDMYRT